KTIAAAKKEIYFQDESTLFALIDILYVEGCEGVKVLLDALKTLYNKDSQLYLHFKRTFLDNQEFWHESLQELLKDSNLEIIRKLADMSPAEKVWWQHLVTQHKEHVNKLDLSELYQGFQEFRKRIPKTISLPIPCPINNAKNMLLALDRFLAVLG